MAQSTRAPRKRRKTSHVWDDFVSVGLGDDGKERDKCKHFGTLLLLNNIISKTQGSYGTPPKKGDRLAYDHMIEWEMVSEVIIYHDLPFLYDEYEKVRARKKYLNLDCQPICTQTVAAEIFRRFEIEKEKLKERLAKHQGIVCFTSDLWTSRYTVTGDALAVKILGCLREWGLENKVFSITLDSAYNNDNMMRILKGQLEMMSGSGSALLCEGNFMQDVVLIS